MGGGDLNLKKSWHPLTMKNLERVWKAEQRHDAEQKRIQELQTEIKEERARDEMQQMAIDAGVMKPRVDRVDWLYKGPGAMNREEYLLGKPIDKAIDPTLIEDELEQEALASGPGSLFVGGSSVGAGSMADIEVKIREDPLFIIRKNEEAAKQKLLDNPIKLQQLQQMLIKSKTKKKHKSEKKSKAKKKRRHDDSTDSESDRDTRRHVRHHREAESSRHEEKRVKKRHRDHSPSERHDTRTMEGGYKRERERGYSTSHDNDRHSRRYRERSPVERVSRDNYSGGRPHYYRGEERRPTGATSVSRKMDPKELERRRQEMMSSAKVRDEEREIRLKKHREALEKEEAEAKEKKGDFLKPLRVQSLTSSSNLEDRIHRKINSVQRTRAALNDNFLKR